MVPTQLYLAGWFVCMDVAILGQYGYLWAKNSGKIPIEEDHGEDDEEEEEEYDEEGGSDGGNGAFGSSQGALEGGEHKGGARARGSSEMARAGGRTGYTPPSPTAQGTRAGSDGCVATGSMTTMGVVSLAATACLTAPVAIASIWRHGGSESGAGTADSSEMESRRLAGGAGGFEAGLGGGALGEEEAWFELDVDAGPSGSRWQRQPPFWSAGLAEHVLADQDRWEEEQRGVLQGEGGALDLDLAWEAERNGTVGPAALWAGRRLVLSPCIPNNNKTKSKARDIAGIVVGSISSFLYLNSRLPQIWKNCSSRSVEGLSWIMFAMAFMGNLTSVTAIFLRIGGKTDWIAEAPFLPGMAGTLFFDMTIMVQYFIFSGEATQRRDRRKRLREEARRRHMLPEGKGGASAPGGAGRGGSSSEGAPLLLDAEGGGAGGQPGSINRDGNDLEALLQDTPAMVPSQARRGVHDLLESPETWGVDAQERENRLARAEMALRGDGN